MSGEGRALHDDDFAEVFALTDLAGDGSGLLLAVSGGPDSVALMHAAAAWAQARAGPPLSVATVDHALRPGSLAEAQAVGVAARALGLDHAVLTWCASSKRASQAAAREARYRLLAGHAAAIGATRIATAHTRDDQAETVLMRLAEGSGLSGLAGMAPVRRLGEVLHLRPFLHLRKADLVATCRARGWSFVDDPSNAEPRFARSRWRALMPALAAEGLDADRLHRLAGRLRRADLALDAVADAVARRLIEAAPGGVAVDFAALVREPDETALRVFLRAVRHHAAEAGRHEHVRLERAEAALAALRAAHLLGRPARRTLADRLLALDARGILTITCESPRRRGR